MAKTYTYQPDYAVSPGETLRELLDDKRMSHADLALRTGLAKKTISQIMTGDGPITLDTADKLELALGVPALFGTAGNWHIAKRWRVRNLLEDSRRMWHG